MSYRKRYIKSKINRIRPKKSIFTRPWFWIIILVLAFVLSAAYFFIFYSGVQVKDIVVFGNQKVLAKEISALINNNLNSNFSRSIFLFNLDKSEKELSDKFPTIESVKISKKFFSGLEVDVKERTATAVFCPTAVDTECYFIDENGITFEAVDQMPSGILVVRQKVSKNLMDLILKIEKDLKENFQIDLKEALVRSLVRLDVSTSENWKIYFDTSSDINLQIAKLNLLLKSEISETQRKNLRYINLIPNSKAIICDNPTCGG